MSTVPYRISIAVLRVFLLCSILVVPIASQVAAQTTPRSPVIIILVPGLRADDLTRPESRGLRQLASQGAVGWMNCRTARVPGQSEESEEAAYVTLGAGARATAGPYARMFT